MLSSNFIEWIGHLKKDVLNAPAVSLYLEEILIALSISATTNLTGSDGGALKELSGYQAHMTHIPTSGDEKGLRRLGVNLPSDAEFSTHSLFEV